MKFTIITKIKYQEASDFEFLGKEGKKKSYFYICGRYWWGFTLVVLMAKANISTIFFFLFMKEELGLPLSKTMDLKRPNSSIFRGSK